MHIKRLHALPATAALLALLGAGTAAHAQDYYWNPIAAQGGPNRNGFFYGRTIGGLGYTNFIKDPSWDLYDIYNNPPADNAKYTYPVSSLVNRLHFGAYVPPNYATYENYTPYLNWTDATFYNPTRSDNYQLNSLSFEGDLAGRGFYLSGNTLNFKSYGIPFYGTVDANIVLSNDFDNTIANNVNLSQTTYLRGNGVGSVLISGLVNGTGGFNKTDSGTYILSGLLNKYSGGTTIAGGVLAITNGWGLGVGDVTLKGGTLRFDSVISTMQFNKVNVNSGTLDTNGNTVVLSKALSGSGNLTKAGEGIMYLTQNDNYSGVFTIAGGTLGIDQKSNLGMGTLRLDGGTLRVYNTLSSLTIAGIDSRSGGTIDTGAYSLAYGGALTGNGDLSKIGNGTLTLNGGGSYGGTFTVRQGVLALGSANALGAGSGVLALDGGTARFTASFTPSLAGVRVTANGGTLDVADNNIILPAKLVGDSGGNLTKTGRGTLTLTGNNYIQGNLAVNQGTLAVNRGNSLSDNGTTTLSNGATLQINRSFATDNRLALGNGGGIVNTGANALTLNNAVSGAGRLTKTGTGTLQLQSDSPAFTGGVTVNGGTVAPVRNGALGTGTVTLNGATLQAVKDLNAPTFGNVTLGTNGGTFEIYANKDVDLFQTIDGTGGLTKTGQGRLNLLSANAYTGGTVIAQGNLAVNNPSGSATGTGPVTVQSSAILSGSGTVAGNVTVESGGVVAPGNSPGTLALLADLTLQDNSFLEIEIGGTGQCQYDRLNVGGNFSVPNFASSLRVSYLNGYGPQIGDSFDFLEVAGQIQIASGFEGLYNIGGYSMRLSQTSQSGGSRFTFQRVTSSPNSPPPPILGIPVAAPEPSSVLLTLCGLTLFVVPLRRRRF